VVHHGTSFPSRCVSGSGADCPAGGTGAGLPPGARAWQSAAPFRRARPWPPWGAPGRVPSRPPDTLATVGDRFSAQKKTTGWLYRDHAFQFLLLSRRPSRGDPESRRLAFRPCFPLRLPLDAFSVLAFPVFGAVGQASKRDHEPAPLSRSPWPLRAGSRPSSRIAAMRQPRAGPLAGANNPSVFSDRSRP